VIKVYKSIPFALPRHLLGGRKEENEEKLVVVKKEGEAGEEFGGRREAELLDIGMDAYVFTSTSDAGK
jgi:hypothetical protein